MQLVAIGTAILFFFASPCRCAERISSGPIIIDHQTGTVISNVHVTSSTGSCITISNSINITVQNSEIGPCGTAGGAMRGNGINLRDSNSILIYDNYIHAETQTSKCCDRHDGIFGENNNKNITIQGNVIAYGESNIEFTGQADLITVRGNFLLNPRGPEPRGQNFQCWGRDRIHGCTNIVLEGNYALASLDTKTYSYAEHQEDSINFGNSEDVIVRNNYISGGHSHSGCGLIADDGANHVRFEGNLLLNTGQCGIGIADGTNQVVAGNRILNSTPVIGGGNTAIYAWKQYPAPCGPAIISNNIADMVLLAGRHNAFWDGGGCGVMLSGNVFGPTASRLLARSSTEFPPPAIPPQPKTCIATSPYTTNTAELSGLPPCSEFGKGRSSR
jgi:hypothetical protein